MIMTADIEKKKTCSEMEAVMAFSESRRKKTRRGKKRHRTNKLSFGCSFEEDSFFIRNEIRSLCKGKQKNFLRPSSPKAPMNSTQFLIEDSGNDRIHIKLGQDCLSADLTCDSSPDQSLCKYYPEMEDHDSRSIFDDHEPTICHQISQDYSLLCVDATTEFVGREFERDFQAMQDSNEEFHAKLKQKQCEFSDMSKQNLIKKYLKLENRLRRQEVRLQTVTNDPLLVDWEKLLKENEFLRLENETLKKMMR